MLAMGKSLPQISLRNTRTSAVHLPRPIRGARTRGSVGRAWFRGPAEVAGASWSMAVHAGPKGQARPTLSPRANPLGTLGRLGPFSKLERDIAQLDDVAIDERCWRSNTLAADERAVRAVEIGEHRRLR